MMFSGTNFLFCFNVRAEQIVMFSQEKKKQISEKKKKIPENNFYFFIQETCFW